MRQVVVLRQVPHEDLGTIDSALRDAGLAIRYLDLYDHPAAELDTAQLCGLVVLGGPMNVDQTDRYPFLQREVEWIQSALSAAVPVLGVCLGSQLLAKALDAAVYPNGSKEIGWYEIETAAAARDDRLFATIPHKPMVFQWHGDTFDLPAGATGLASSPACANQAFRYGESAYGLQFHLEVTAEMIDRWLDEPENRKEIAGLDEIDAASIRSQTPKHISALHEMARTVFAGFAEACRLRPF